MANGEDVGARRGNNGALSAAVATASIEDLAGAILLACSDEAFDQPQKSDRMRMLAVRYRRDASLTCAAVARTWGRKTLVTVHDERAQHAESAYSEAANRPRFSGRIFKWWMSSHGGSSPGRHPTKFGEPVKRRQR